VLAICLREAGRQSADYLVAKATRSSLNAILHNCLPAVSLRAFWPPEHEQACIHIIGGHNSALTTLTGCAYYIFPHELTITTSKTATALNVHREHAQLQLRTHGAAKHLGLGSIYLFFLNNDREGGEGFRTWAPQAPRSARLGKLLSWRRRRQLKSCVLQPNMQLQFKQSEC
jgi:hypothetical protein